TLFTANVVLAVRTQNRRDEAGSPDRRPAAVVEPNDRGWMDRKVDRVAVGRAAEQRQAAIRRRWFCCGRLKRGRGLRRRSIVVRGLAFLGARATTVTGADQREQSDRGHRGAHVDRGPTRVPR